LVEWYGGPFTCLRIDEAKQAKWENYASDKNHKLGNIRIWNFKFLVGSILSRYQ
jgi:hypothetical protein